MAQIFKWYFILTIRYAREGEDINREDYQLHTGPSLGAFNEYVKGSQLEDWKNRHVDEIGIQLMNTAAQIIINKYT